MAVESEPLLPRTKKRVCLVTEELPNFGASGGIGAAFEEMAFLLSRAEHEVTILYCGPQEEGGALPEAGVSLFRSEGVNVVALDVEKHTNVKHDLRANSYAVWKTLLEADGDFDVIHFHDYKGLGFYACEGKRQGLGLRNSQLVVQLHGPSRWTVEANKKFFCEENQLVADYLEKRSVELADQRVSPSSYLANWARDKWGLSDDCDIDVIPNLCGLLEQRLRRVRRGQSSDRSVCPIKNLVIFGRHEDRKGINVAISALGPLNDLLATREIAVHFVGQQGVIEGQPSALYLVKQAASWKFEYTLNFGLNRFTAGEYISSLDNVLVVVPAPVENSPYAVLEPLMLGFPVLSSSDGGGGELVAPECRAEFCCHMESATLADSIERLIGSESLECKPSRSALEVEELWLQFHQRVVADNRLIERNASEEPLVTIGITHHERPQKLGDAVISMLKQDYGNLEIIVVDDGTKSAESVKALNELAVLLERSDVTLLREPNRYLGAARNKILEHAKGEYVVFLDDDDIALPNLVTTLVRSAVRTNAGVTACMSHYMPEDSRMQFLSGQLTGMKVDYFPTGGPLSLSLEQNIFGTATSLIRISDLQEIGGYSELRGVGNEDFELYIKLAQAGKEIAVCPAPLFMYEVGRPSMLSGTSIEKGFRRCFDSVDFSENSSAWEDYCNLNVGRHLAPHADNRQRWLNSFQKDSDERNRLCDPSTDTREYMEIAANIADRAGVTRLATAFRHAFEAADCLLGRVASAEEASQLAEHPILRPLSSVISAHKEIAELPRELRRVRHMISVGDVERAQLELAAYLGSTYSIDESILVVIQDLADLEVTESNGLFVSMVVAALREKPYRGEASQVPLSLLRVAEKQGLESLRAEIVEYLIDLDRKDYLDRYPDIREAFEHDGLEPFKHFVRQGRVEGRVGFQTLKVAMESLKNSSGITYAFEDFSEMANSVEVKTSSQSNKLDIKVS